MSIFPCFLRCPERTCTLSVMLSFCTKVKVAQCRKIYIEILVVLLSLFELDQWKSHFYNYIHEYNILKRLVRKQRSTSYLVDKSRFTVIASSVAIVTEQLCRKDKPTGWYIVGILKHPRKLSPSSIKVGTYKYTFLFNKIDFKRTQIVLLLGGIFDRMQTSGSDVHRIKYTVQPTGLWKESIRDLEIDQLYKRGQRLCKSREFRDPQEFQYYFLYLYSCLICNQFVLPKCLAKLKLSKN